MSSTRRPSVRSLSRLQLGIRGESSYTGFNSICGNGAFYYAYFNESLHRDLSDDLKAVEEKYCAADPNELRCKHRKAYVYQAWASGFFQMLRLATLNGINFIPAYYQQLSKQMGIDLPVSFIERSIVSPCLDKLQEVQCDLWLPKCGSTCFKRKLCRRDCLELRENCPAQIFESITDDYERFGFLWSATILDEYKDDFNRLFLGMGDAERTGICDPSVFPEECYEVTPDFEGSLEECFSSNTAEQLRDVVRGESGVYKNGKRSRSGDSLIVHSFGNGTISGEPSSPLKGLVNDTLPEEIEIVPNSTAPYRVAAMVDNMLARFSEIAHVSNLGAERFVDSIVQQWEESQDVYSAQVEISHLYLLNIRLCLSFIQLLIPIYFAMSQVPKVDELTADIVNERLGCVRLKKSHRTEGRFTHNLTPFPLGSLLQGQQLYCVHDFLRSVPLPGLRTQNAHEYF